MDHTSETQQNTASANTSASNEAQYASFTKTLASIEELVGTKVDKVLAAKSLVIAEAKVSLSALLLSFCLALGVLCIAIILWLLINVALGLTIYNIIPSVALALAVAIILNLCLAFYLSKQLKQTWDLVGLRRSFSAFNKEQ